MELEKLRKVIATEFELVGKIAKESKNDFDAGRYDGLKQALAIIDSFTVETNELSNPVRNSKY